MVLLLAVLSFFSSLQSVFCRMYTAERKGAGALQFAVFYCAFTGLGTLAVNGFSYRPSMITLGIGLINALLLLIYNVSMVKCSAIGSYAFMMISALSGGILVPMVYDLLYTGYSFSAMQIVAVVLMLASFVIMNVDGLREKKNARYLALCAGMFIVNGLYTMFLNLQQSLMNYTQRSEILVTAFLGMGILTSLFELIFHRKEFVEGCRMSKKAAVLVVLSSLCVVVAGNLMLYVMKNFPITVLSLFSNGGVLIFTALFAFVVFREKMEKHTIVGMLIACVSIIMLSI